jgi:hypothetical protein
MNPLLAKFQLYKRLYALNRSFTLVALNCERLERLGFFRSEYLQACRVMVEHLQAEANGELIETLHEWELKEASRLDQMRRQWEDQTKDPDDVFFQAADRKRELREQIKDLKQREQRGRTSKKKRRR